VFFFFFFFKTKWVIFFFFFLVGFAVLLGGTPKKFPTQRVGEKPQPRPKKQNVRTRAKGSGEKLLWKKISPQQVKLAILGRY